MTASFVQSKDGFDRNWSEMLNQVKGEILNSVSQEVISIELFVMPGCPYAAEFQKRLIPLLLEHREKVDFKVWFISPVSDYMEFLNMDSPDISEKVVQSELQIQYPDKILDYLNLRLNTKVEHNRDVILKSIGITPKEFLSVLSKEKALDSFKDNIEVSISKHIDKSPSLLLNGTLIQKKALTCATTVHCDVGGVSHSGDPNCAGLTDGTDVKVNGRCYSCEGAVCENSASSTITCQLIAYTCDEPSKYCNPDKACCGDQEYVTATHGCCSPFKILYNLNTEGCCGNFTKFTKSTQSCCEDKWVYTTDGNGCCKDGPYDLTSEGCCQGTSTYDQATENCCGSNKYVTSTHGCCSTAVYDPVTHGCCGNKTYRHAIKGCCGNVRYNRSTKFCCGDLIWNISGNTCCGGTTACASGNCTNGVCSDPLPIVLKSFDATWWDQKGQVVKLAWITTLEIENDYFEIEKSNDGIGFEVVGRVAGSGTVKTESSYTLFDSNIVHDLVYYRLKQVDFNGDYNYSKVTAISRESDFFEHGLRVLNIFPNPVDHHSQVLYATPFQTEVIIRLYSISGQLINTCAVKSKKGMNHYTFSGQALPTGDYLIKFSTNQGTSTARVQVH